MSCIGTLLLFFDLFIYLVFGVYFHHEYWISSLEMEFNSSLGEMYSCTFIIKVEI